MRTALLLFFVASLHAASMDRLKDAVFNGTVTKSMIDSLTPDDIPEQWRSRVEEKKTESYFLRTFYRGEKKVLSVLWSNDWVDKKSKMFVASVYDGEKRIYHLPRLEDSIGFSLAKNEDYEIYLIQKDSGEMTLSVMHPEGFFECIVIAGRDTHLIDDFAYTKQALAIQHIALPVIGAFKEMMEEAKKTNQAPEQTPTSVMPAAKQPSGRP